MISDDPRAQARSVRGTVRHADGTPIHGMTVRAFRRRVAGEDLLGESRTQDRGEYLIGYDPPAGISAVDVFVRACDDKNAIVAVSPIAIGAGAQAQLDLTVTDARFRGPSEFDRITQALSSQVTAAAIHDLDADDIALLVRRTQVPRSSVTAWVASKRLADRVEIDHESLYALVRMENTASLPRLLRRYPERLERSLAQAARMNMISQAAGQRAQTTVRDLRPIAVRLSASRDTPGSLGRLLATTSRISADQQRGFIERYGRHTGTPKELWSALRKDPAFGDAAVDDIQLSVQLGTLTANHAPLVKALRAKGIQRASDTAMLSAAQWRELLASKIDGAPVGTPENIKGSTAEERIDNFVTLLTERTTLAFPTAHVAKALKALPEWKSSPAAAFLERNPHVKLTSATLETILKSPDTVIEPGWDREKLEADLATVQRVARIAPRGREEPVVNGLLAAGHTSAFSIARRSLAAFVRDNANVLGGDRLAREVHRNAQFQVGRSLSAYALMHPSVGGPTVKALGSATSTIAGDATWASLFGDVDYCACEHCRSIYSPAAYLVDLLAWLDGHKLKARSALDLLNERRPDIQRIELSCENTNTVVPYVDLVNEILEVRILNPRGDRAGGPTVPQASTGASADLLANPEHLNPQVYDAHLAKAVFPDVLPFDLWGELGRVYFEHLGLRRSDLMEALRRKSAPSRAAVDAERLRLSAAQWLILTGQAPHEVREYWGYPSEANDGASFKEHLAVVSDFLRKARIGFDELLDLLHSWFANPGRVRIHGSACNTDRMTLEPLRDDDLLRMHVFLRLWRNRGWTMLELDKALHALSIAKLDGAALGRLADLDRVVALSGAPLLDALSWWSTIDTFADRPEKAAPVKPLYDRVFLNLAVDSGADEPDFPLALDAARHALANTVAWDDVRSLLQAALAISADDLSPLIDETIDGSPNPRRVVTGAVASLEGLSALYRHVSLARALNIKVSELSGLIRLTGIDPFDRANTAETIRLLETVARIRASAFSLDELHYLLEHDAQAETRVGVTDEAIGRTLVEIRDGLARVAVEFAVTADPTGEVTSRFLAALLDADAVAAVMAALQTPANGANDAGLAETLLNNLGSLFSFNARALIALPVERRFPALLSELGPYLQETQSAAVVIEKTATFAGRELSSVEDLLSLRVGMIVDGRTVPAIEGLRVSPYMATTTSEIVATDDAEAFATLRKVYKAACVLAKLQIDIGEQVWLFDVGVRLGLANPVALPVVTRSMSAGAWRAWERLVDLFALRKDLPGGEPTLLELLRLLESTDDPVPAEETFRAQLAARTGWLRADVDYLISAFDLRYPDDWRDGGALRKLVDAFALIRRAGVSAAQADGWVTAEIGAAQAEELRLAAKAKHDEARWPEVARALRDPVREKQRTALVAYLIAKNPSYTDEEDLYADLLIDVEMCPCMLTSRIKQAISSVQLFVQRALLNLENGIELTRDDLEQWEWMKTYRVWEAARKVFLYPENWIEPDLRIDKSPLFKELENALLQGEITAASVEKAYTAFLEGLLTIARLEVMGLYHQLEDDEDGTVDILHVVARTRSHPHEYYYRQWIDSREWTPWEKLDVDIEGHHVVLAVHERRLYLFWPIVAQMAEGDEDRTYHHFEMRLAWIERMHGRWGARKLSEDALEIDGMWNDLDVSALGSSELASNGEWATYFRLADDSRLIIECRQGHSAAGGGALLGRFVMDSGTGMVTVDHTRERSLPLVAPAIGFVQRMRFILTTGWYDKIEDGHTSFSLMQGTLDPSGRLVGEAEEVLLLGKVAAPGPQLGWSSKMQPGAFGGFAYPHQYGEFASQHGVFLDDNERTFHVMPVTSIDWERLLEKDRADPSMLGTIASTADVFMPPVQETRFEPEIPWDALQLPIAAATADADGVAPGATALPVSGAIGSAVSGTLGAAALDASAPTRSGFLFDALSSGNLLQSQKQLIETTTVADTFTHPSTTKYRFRLFYHPYVRDFMTELRRSGVSGLLDPNPDGPAARLVRQRKSRPEFFASAYEPTENVLAPYPVQDIDFDPAGAYAQYNWELFFHAPLLVASRLSRNQRFEEARRWFHFMFDPTNRSDESDPLRFWKIRPFHREADAPIEAFLALAAADADSPEALVAREAYDDQIDAWLKDPFNPHAIARLRTTAYQKSLVMKYLDNLIAWADQLFRRDTLESVNEATQLYLLALELLGERPDALPPRSKPVPKTFEQVRAALDDSTLNNPLVRLENLIFKPLRPARSVSGITPAATAPTRLLFGAPVPASPAFYFCIPPNEKLLAYWDTVADRLFKIRNCMNIEGVVRQLPLFEPPIDPGMLVRARAAGVDLSSALADLNAPLPHYRFSVMLQKAYALNQTVRSLGGALLDALEKQDSEALATLRARQEVALLEAVREVKKLAIDEARHGLAAAERSLEAVRQRQGYYRSLLDAGWLGEEQAQLALQITAGGMQAAASIASLIAAALVPVPKVQTGGAGAMGSPLLTTEIVDGAKLAKVLSLGERSLSLLGSAAMTASSALGVSSSFKRRAQEWQQQLDAAALEIGAIEKQVEAARVRVALAERDLASHERQIAHAEAVRELMESRFTGVELYQWMVGQISSLYFQSYQLAYDLAKRAERAWRHELARPEASFIRFGYWDSLKKGLLAGERLQLDLERMDAAYLENDRREYEITKHVSLALLDPIALLKLRTEGECELSIPEAWFDLDYPGHYMRRIKSVSVTVPCVTGPYTGLPLRVSLVSSRTRIDPTAAGTYAFDASGSDSRFQIHTGAAQSITLSGGRDDAGLFSADPRDERYLPFEGHGAVSDWNLKLASAVPTFDWSTLTDVILHIRYTAREGGELLRQAALSSLAAQLAGLPLRRAFSAKREFPTQWNAFLRPAADAAQAVLGIDLSKNRFPYIAQDAGLEISSLELVAVVKDAEAWAPTDFEVAAADGDSQTVSLVSAPGAYAGNPSATVSYPDGMAPGRWTFSVPTSPLGAPSAWIEDLFVVASYQLELPVH